MYVWRSTIWQAVSAESPCAIEADAWADSSCAADGLVQAARVTGRAENKAA
jgi:hypothetical protein